METGLLLQSLLWGGLVLAVLSELFRPRIQGISGSIVSFDLGHLKRSLSSIALPALVPIVFAVLLQFYAGFSNAFLFVIAFALPWLLSSIIQLPAVSGLLVLAGVWGLSSFSVIQPDALLGIHSAILSGLLLYQLLQSMQTDKIEHDARLILPASLWLIGTTWIQAAIPGEFNVLVLQTTTAAVLILGAIFRLLPVSNNAVLERYGKPIALAVAAAGSICVLGDVVLHQPSLTRWALLVLGGILAGSYFSLQQDDAENASLLHRLLNLAVLGIVMLVASRLYGTLGWIVTACAIALTHIQKGTSANSIWQVATLFLLGRSLLQVFIYNNNPNVTGINVTHPYASVALFTGIVLILCARDIHRQLSAAGSLALWVLVALGSCYYLHAEATGSLLVSMLFAAGAVSFSPSVLSIHSTQVISWMNQSRTKLVSLAAWLVSYCALAAPGIELGNSATKTTKLLFLIVPIVVGALLIKPLAVKPNDSTSKA